MALDRDEVGARVLEIAEALLEEGGADQLKARTVASRAGIALGSIYNLYGDMDALHVAVNLKLIAGLEQAGMAAIGRLKAAHVTDTRECLLELARTYLDYVEAHQKSWMALVAFPAEKIGADRQANYFSRLDGLMSIISGVLRLDGSLGLDAERAKLSAHVLWSSVHGIVTNTRRIGGPGGTDPAWRQIDHLVRVFLTGLRAEASGAG